MPQARPRGEKKVPIICILLSGWWLLFSFEVISSIWDGSFLFVHQAPYKYTASHWKPNLETELHGVLCLLYGHRGKKICNHGLSCYFAPVQRQVACLAHAVLLVWSAEVWMSHSTYTFKGLPFDQKSVLLSQRKKLYWLHRGPLPASSKRG